VPNNPLPVVEWEPEPLELPLDMPPTEKSEPSNDEHEGFGRTVIVIDLA
jgi:hypothetical protein